MRSPLFSCVMFVLLATPLHAAEPVTMMTNAWTPYVDEKLPAQGLAVELASHIFARAGYQADNTVERWPRALEGVRIGLYDVLGATWYDDDREADFLFSQPYMLNELIVVKRRDRQGKHFSLGDLDQARIGLLQDYAYGVDFSDIPQSTLVYENHIIQNLMNLLNNKVDYVIGDRRVIALQLQEYLAGRRHELEVLNISLPPRSLHVAASRSNPRHQAIIKAFNTALKEVKRDGSYQKIVAKWQQRYPL